MPQIIERAGSRIVPGTIPSVPAQPVGGDPVADPILKAVVAGMRRGKAQRGPAYVEHSVYESVRRYTSLAGGILDDQTPHLDAWALRSLANRNVVIQAILHTLLNQVAAHFVRPPNEKAIGARVVQKQRDKALTQSAANEAKRIEDIIFDGGVQSIHPETGEPAVWDGHGEDTADDLQTAVRKIMRDSLILDRAFIVTEGALSGKNPVLFWKHVDGALIRKALRSYIPQIRNGANGTDDLTGRTKYVQMAPDYDFKVDREYAWNEGLLAFRNPKPDLLAFGYGGSEVEQCLMAVTGILYVMQGNTDWFTHNHVPQGVVTAIGAFGQDELEMLRDQLSYEVGATGSSIWTTPVIHAPSVQGMQSALTWTPFVDRSRMDMVSKTYMELCVALAAAVFQIQPEEFGFSGFGGPDTSLSSGSDEDKLQHSQHKGLLPKVLWLCRFISAGIVERINPEFELEIQGLDAVYNPEQLLKAQLDTALMQNGATMNQIAARNDEAPIVDPLDQEAWQEIKSKLDQKFFATERERLEACIEAYKAQGGKLGSYPDAPVSCPGAMQIWMQEHLGDQTQAQGEMGQMAQTAQANDDQQKMADRQGAQADMQSQGQQENEFQQGERQTQADAARKNELRIPMQDDAGQAMQRMQAIRKAIRVYRKDDA